MATRDGIISIKPVHFVGKNRFVYTFPGLGSTGNIFANGEWEVAITDYSIYHCTYNISQEIGNNWFKVKWVDGVTYQYTIYDGYYSIDELFQAMSSAMAMDGLYTLESSTAKYTTMYFNIAPDLTKYASSFTIYKVPSISSIQGTSIQKPSGISWNFPNVDTAPEFELAPLLATQYLGFTKNIFTNKTASQTITEFSPNAPQVTITNSYVVCCSLIDNGSFGTVSEEMMTIPINNISFGVPATSNGQVPNYLPIKDGVHNVVQLYILDQDLKPITLKDKLANFTLTVRRKQ